MTANEARLKVRDKYKTLLGRNRYSQPRRSYVYEPYSNGLYYSDCSSSIAATYKECGFPITYGGSSLPNTEGFYHSKDMVEVPVKINSKGEITNPEALRIADSLLFAGDDSSRSGSGYVGHVEMVGEITDSGKIYIYGHGSGTPRRTEMQAYLRKRRSQKSSTKLGHKGLIKVVRRIRDDGNSSENPNSSNSPETPDRSTGYKLGDRILKNGMSGSDVAELQTALIKLGYSCGPDGADGEFGDNTEKAVRGFQRARGLTVDGEAGPDTIAVLQAAIGNASNPAPPQPAGARVVIANCKECNIRTGPGTQYGSVGTARPGDSFPALAADGWTPVLYYGNICWISEKYATKEGT